MFYGGYTKNSEVIGIVEYNALGTERVRVGRYEQKLTNNESKAVNESCHRICSLSWVVNKGDYI